MKKVFPCETNVIRGIIRKTGVFAGSDMLGAGRAVNTINPTREDPIS